MPEGNMDFMGLEEAPELHEEEITPGAAAEEAPETPAEAPESPAMPLQADEEGVDDPEEPEAPEEPQELSAEDMLAQVREAYTEPKKPTNLTQADIDRALDERMARLARPEATVAAEPESDSELQAFQALLERSPEEERPGLIVNFQQLREKKLRAEMEARIEEDKKVRTEEAEKQQSIQQLRENLDWGLRAAGNMGGMKAAVVKEFVESGDYERLVTGKGFGTSKLAQIVAVDPRVLLSGQSMLLATYAAAGVAEDLFRQKTEQPQPNGEQPKQAERLPAATRTTAVSAKASPEPKPKKKLSPEEKYVESIRSSGTELKQALPFLDYNP